ncbi:MAG: FKBP-type peptidyl-prolyl cis-trans isomerase [Desulfosudaceae bacterium]
MTQAKSGDKVKVHYTGKFENGETFDSSQDREPLEFTIGNGEIIEGFEESVVGMTAGETKQMTIEPDKGYGHYQEELAVEVERAQIPPDIEVEIGQQLQIRQPDGEVINVTVTDVSEESVILDANHPLAGKDLHFDIELVEVNND